jgi:hypothetical protein
MDERQALDPVEFQFGELDQLTYGNGWYRYAEADLIRLPARTLIELEGALGMPIVDVMNGMRMSTVLGDTAAAWLGVREVDPKLAGPFDQFNPITMLIKWRKAVDEGKDQGATAVDPTQSAPATPEPGADGSPIAGQSHQGTSGQPDTVILQTLPIAE